MAWWKAESPIVSTQLYWTLLLTPLSTPILVKDKMRTECTQTTGKHVGEHAWGSLCAILCVHNFVVISCRIMCFAMHIIPTGQTFPSKNIFQCKLKHIVSVEAVGVTIEETWYFLKFQLTDQQTLLAFHTETRVWFHGETDLMNKDLCPLSL